MAKKASKTEAKAPAAKKASAPAPAPAKKTVATGVSIEKATQQALSTLQSLGIEQSLQQDIEWCLGSFQNDKNPSGLYEMTSKALTALKEAKNRKAKGVTTKLIADIEKALEAK